MTTATRVWSREQNPDIFAMARSRAPKPSLTMAYLSLLLAAVGVVLSLVALVGIWWFGEINPAIFGGAFKGRGSLSLWGFATSADLLGISLPTTFLELDDGACGPSSPLRGEEMCRRLHAIRGLVVSSVAFMGFALISSIFALFAMGDCCHGKHRIRSQLSTAFMAMVSVACMVCALAIGCSTDTEHVMMEFGGMGAAFYSAVAQILVGFVAVNISCVGGCFLLTGQPKEDARAIHNSEASGV